MDEYITLRAHSGKEVQVDRVISHLIGSFEGIWFHWILENWSQLLNPGRDGIPRGQPVPIRGQKFLAAAGMLLYPKCLKTTNAVAMSFRVGHGVLRNWLGNTKFKNQIKVLEVDFSVYVLERLENPVFLEDLYCSNEMIGWNDQVLRYFIINLARSLEGRNLQHFTDHAKRVLLRQVEEIFGDKYGDLLLHSLDIYLPQDIVTTALAGDILKSAVEAYGSEEDSVKIGVLLWPHYKKFERVMVINLEKLEDAVKTRKPKSEILQIIDLAKRFAAVKLLKEETKFPYPELTGLVRLHAEPIKKPADAGK